MAKNLNRDIFDYCERLYTQYSKEDNGYSPSKHDKKVFINAAQHFNKSVEEIDKIYDSYTKLSAKIEIEKIKRLPPKKQKAAYEKLFSNILKNNHDLPFCQLEGESTDPLITNNQIIVDEYLTTVKNVALAGWTIPMIFDFDLLSELRNNEHNQSLIDNFFMTYYTLDLFTEMCNDILEKIKNPGQQTRFNECITAYSNALYSSCVTVLTTILEGLISTFGDNPQNVRIMRICDFHAQEEANNGNQLKSLCWHSIYEFSTLLFQPSDFTQDEPFTINRHWLIHGRTTQAGTKIHCLKLFNAISTVCSFISEI